MLAYAISAALLVQAPSQQPTPSRQSRSEQIGSWEVRTVTDPVTDDTTIGMYLGTRADSIALACAQDDPGSMVFVWQSSTYFPTTGYWPRTADELTLLGRLQVGNVTYRFDQDEPVDVQTTVRDDRKAYFHVGDVRAVTSRIGSASRLVLRDSLNRTHTVVLDLVPADTTRALQRLHEACGVAPTPAEEQVDELANQ